MSDDVAENMKSPTQWTRGLFMLLFVIVLELTKVVLIAVTLIQFVFAILTGAGNENLTRFGGSLSEYLRQLASFLTYNSEAKPFPFSEWPNVDDAGSEDLPPTTGS